MSDTKESKEEVIGGRRAVAEALAAGRPINRIYLARQAGGPDIEGIKELARQRQVRFDFVEVGKLGRLTGGRGHQDVAAVLSPVQYITLDSFLQQVEDQPRLTLVALDQLQHPRNVGMVMRTAAGAGAAAVLLPTRGGRLISDEVVQSSAGAVFRLPVVACANLRSDLQRLKACGFWVYGLDADGDTELFEVQWPGRQVLVAGNEARGLRPSIRSVADGLVRIPLARELDSLNVAVATGIALFELVRQARRKSDQ